MFTSPHECGLCTHQISSSTNPRLVGCSRKGPHFLQKNPPAEISGYGPEHPITVIEAFSLLLQTP